MSPEKGSSRADHMPGPRLAGGVMEKKSPELSLRGLSKGLEKPLAGALLGGGISLNVTVS